MNDHKKECNTAYTRPFASLWWIERLSSTLTMVNTQAKLEGDMSHFPTVNTSSIKVQNSVID